MDKEALLRAEMRSIVETVNVPPISLDAIHRKMATPISPRPTQLAQYAALAAALLLVVVPLTSRSVVPTLQAKINELLHITSTPPPLPQRMQDSVNPTEVTLDQAQAKVHFSIVAPAGLPSDVTTSKITLTPSLVYGPLTHGWQAGQNAVEFGYSRSDHRFFRIEASAYDPKAQPPSKYMFEADEVDAKGMPRRYERFYWRNGNQMMSVVAEGISATEIAAIREAMRGEPIATVWPPKRAGNGFFMKLGNP